MFRRSSKSETTQASKTGGSTDLAAARPGAKGRPTPSRKEAEAAARERAKVGMDKKSAQKLTRERRLEQNSKVRQGMRTGDERYLPARDKGPVKRFIRDQVDSRLSIAEFLLPLLVLIMVLQYSSNDSLMRFGIVLWEATILLVLIDTGWLLFKLKRSIKAKFPDESTRGTTFYTLLRAMQLRPLRQPKPQVKIGGKPK